MSNIREQVEWAKEKVKEYPYWWFPPKSCCHTMDYYEQSIDRFTYCPFCGRKLSKYIKRR